MSFQKSAEVPRFELNARRLGRFEDRFERNVVVPGVWKNLMLEFAVEGFANILFVT